MSTTFVDVAVAMGGVFVLLLNDVWKLYDMRAGRGCPFNRSAVDVSREAQSTA